MSRQLVPSIRDGAPGAGSPSFSAEERAKILKDLKYVKFIWESIDAVLKDAEELEIKKVSMKYWLCDLRYLAFELQDLAFLLRDLAFDLDAEEAVMPDFSIFYRKLVVRSWIRCLGRP